MERVALELDNVRVRVREAPESALWWLHHGLAFLSVSAPGDVPLELLEGDDAPDDSKYTWDGMVRFLRQPKPRKDGTRAAPWFEMGLLPRAMSLLAEKGYAVQVFDFRQRPEADDVPRFWPKQPLRDYQDDAVESSIRAGRGVIVAPPRAGKTRIILELIRRLNLPALLVSPTTSIVDQTVLAARDYGYDEEDVCRLEGGDEGKAPKAMLWVCTVAKAILLDKELAKTRQVIVCDELHHFTKGGAWGKQLQKLFGHVFYWFGASGTYFRSGGDDMSLEAFLSGVVYTISSTVLLGRGLLVPTRFAFVPMDCPRLRSSGMDARRDGIQRHEHRNGLAASASIHMAKTGRRVLVMVGVKAQGEMIEKLCNEHGPPGKRGGWKFAEFLFRGRGGAPAADMSFRRRLLAAFLDGTGPAVLIGTSLLGEGVDLPDADALVWARGESAAVSYLQGCFRVCTASPGKQSALIVDFADRHHDTLMKASMARLEIAVGEPVFQVSVLPSAEHLAAWAGRPE